MLSNINFVATLAALVNYNLKDGEAPDSYNILPAFTGLPSKPIRNNLLISPSSKNHISIRKGKWMFINGKDGGGFTAQNVDYHSFRGAAAFPFTGQKNSAIKNGKIKDNALPTQLNDLEKDPHEYYCL